MPVPNYNLAQVWRSVMEAFEEHFAAQVGHDFAGDLTECAQRRKMLEMPDSLEA